MRGGLQGDFSVFLEPRKNFSGVLLQQGRVLLDSDWNAQVDLVAERIQTETRDLVGAGGGPAEDAGFEIRAEPRLSFNGNDHYLTLQGLPIPRDASGFTFEAWICPRPAGGDQVLFGRFIKQAAGGFAPTFILEVTPDRRLRLRGGAAVLTTERQLVAGRFQHIALAYTRESTTLYLAGELAGEHAHGGFMGETESAFLLGAKIEGTTASQGFDGLLHEVRMWSVARGPHQVGRDPLRPLTGGEEGLLGCWLFDRPVLEITDIGDQGPSWILGGGRSAHCPEWSMSSLEIGAGRYYVDGILCRNDAIVAFDQQPDYPGAQLPQPRPGMFYLFYLDVWEQLVTYLEDPEIREVALGGADTTVRSRTVSQVKVLPVPRDGELPADEVVLDEWQAFRDREQHHGRLSARREPAAGVLGNLLYRVEIHTSGGLYGGKHKPSDDELVAKVTSFKDGDSASRLELGEWPWEADPWRVGDRVEVWNDLTDSADRPGMKAVITALDPDRRTVALDASLGDLAGHPERLRRIATFKWSRQNASVIFPISTDELEPKGVIVVIEDQGQGELALEAGDWVELFDDAMMLEPRPGPLYQVKDVDDVTRRVTLSAPLDLAAGAENPALRRWEQKPKEGQTFDDGVIVAQSGWLLLESGIEVAFDGDGPYRARDYWWLPARTLSNDIEWPRSHGEPVAVPPHGIAHHYAILAVLGHGDDGIRLRDCRKTFQPLVDGAVSKDGDTMYGPLVIRSDLTVEGAGIGELGRVDAGVFHGPLGSPDSVGTFNLTAGSVTAGKLAPGIGTVPPEYSILGPTPEPPPGYAYTGSSLAAYHGRADWSEREPLPRRDPGPLRGAVVGDRLYVFLESGEVWEYDPARDHWRSRCHRPVAGQGFAVAAARERIYVVGGIDAAGTKTGTTLIYDPASNAWTSGQDMPTPRSHLALAVADGRIYALGGLRGSWLGERASARNEALDVSSDTWMRRQSLPEARYDAAAVAAGGQVHLFGGVCNRLSGLFGARLTGSHDEYQPSTDRWLRHRAPLPTPRTHPGVAVIEDRIYALGGGGLIGPLAEVEEFDLAARNWRRGQALPEPADWPAAGAAGGLLIAVGGEDTPECPGIPARQLQAAAVFFVHRKQEPDGDGVEPGESGGGDAVASPFTGDAWSSLAEPEFGTSGGSGAGGADAG